MTVPTVGLLGLHFASLTRGQVVEHVFAELAQGRGGWIATLNVDYVRRSVADPETRLLLSKVDLLVADGVPLLWAARIQGTPLPDRVAGSDLVWLLAERAAREGRSLYLLGGSPGAAEGALLRLQARWPGLHIAGVSSPVFSSHPTALELDPVRDHLAGAVPDLVYVALGSPKQDRVIEQLRISFPAMWWVGVGVSLSFASGELRRAPAWMQKTGLEWLHRLAQEPARLAYRYLGKDLPFAVRLLARSCRVRLQAARRSALAGTSDRPPHR